MKTAPPLPHTAPRAHDVFVVTANVDREDLRVLPLADAPLTVGRSGSDILIADGRGAKRHLTVERQGDRCLLINKQAAPSL